MRFRSERARRGVVAGDRRVRVLHSLARGAAVVALGVWLGCGPPPPAAPPGQRIVSLSPAITSVLLTLGAGPEIVAVDRFSKRLPGLEEMASLGGLFSPDMERTVELQPTLVLVVRSVEQAAFCRQLRGRGIRVEEIEAHTLEEVLGSFGLIGGYVGRAAEARALLTRLRAELRQIVASVQGMAPVRVALVIEREPLYVAGHGAFIHDLIEAAGGINVFADLAEPYPRVSLEALADREPDLILDTAFDPEAGLTELADRETVDRYWKRFGWVRRVEPLSSKLVTLPAPSLIEVARMLRARIHPEAEAR